MTKERAKGKNEKQLISNNVSKMKNQKLPALFALITAITFLDRFLPSGYICIEDLSHIPLFRLRGDSLCTLLFWSIHRVYTNVTVQGRDPPFVSAGGWFGRALWFAVKLKDGILLWLVPEGSRFPREISWYLEPFVFPSILNRSPCPALKHAAYIYSVIYSYWLITGDWSWLAPNNFTMHAFLEYCIS